MSASVVNINKSIQAITVYLVHCMAQKEDCSSKGALKKLLRSMTYELLQDRNSGLYAESAEYVWQMLLDEENGNIDLRRC